MSEQFAEPIQQIDRVFVRSHGRKLLYFGGCDYYRLSSDARIIQVLRTALNVYGLNTAASRMTTGNHVLYEKIERSSAAFFGASSAVFTSSGYLTNVAVAQALQGDLEYVLVDERSHSSLRDAARLIGCKIMLFHHRDPLDLERRLLRVSRSRVAIATDGMFAFDGSIAPLAEYRAAAGPEPLLWVDDAHGAGVLGPRSQGSIEHAGISRKNVIQTVTFSKAFGVYGGAILCTASLRRALIAKSSALAGNTPLPLPLAAAVLAALRLANSASRERLRKNIDRFWQFFANDSALRFSPIIAIRARNPRSLSRSLIAAGIYPSFIRYPGGPSKGYFRIALSSQHTPKQVTQLALTLRRAEASPCLD